MLGSTTVTMPFKSSLDVLYAVENGSEQQQIALARFERELCNIFRQQPSPCAQWTFEFVSLAITTDGQRYKQILSTYLSFLQNEPLLEQHHIQGLVDLLNLAQHEWLDASHHAQIWDILLKKNFLWDVENHDYPQLQTTLSLWQHILCSLHERRIQIDEGHKNRITDLLQSYRSRFEQYGDKSGKHLVNFAEQAVLRLRHTGFSPWMQASLHVFSAFRNGLDVAAACASSTTNYGLGLVGVLPPLLMGLYDIGLCIVTVCEEIKKKYKKDAWYYQLRQLQCLLMGCIFEKAEENFPRLIQELMSFDNPRQVAILAHGLLANIEQILKTPLGEQREVVQQGCLNLLYYFFEVITESHLKQRVFQLFLSALTLPTLFDGVFYHIYPKIAACASETLQAIPVTEASCQGLMRLYQWLNRQLRLNTEQPENCDVFLRLQQEIIGVCAGCYQASSDPTQKILALGLLTQLQNDPDVVDKSLIGQTLRLLSSHDEDSYKMTIGSVQQKTMPALAQVARRPSLFVSAWYQLDLQVKIDLSSLNQMLLMAQDSALNASSGPQLVNLCQALTAWLAARTVLSVSRQILENIPNFEHAMLEYDAELLEHTKQILERECRQVNTFLSSTGSSVSNPQVTARMTVAEFYRVNYTTIATQAPQALQSPSISQKDAFERRQFVGDLLENIHTHYLSSAFESQFYSAVVQQLKNNTDLSNPWPFYAIFTRMIQFDLRARSKLFSDPEKALFEKHCTTYIQKYEPKKSFQLNVMVKAVVDVLIKLQPFFCFSALDIFSVASTDKNIVRLFIEKMNTDQYKSMLNAVGFVCVNMKSLHHLLEKMEKNTTDRSEKKQIQVFHERLIFHFIHFHQLVMDCEKLRNQLKIQYQQGKLLIVSAEQLAIFHQCVDNLHTFNLTIYAIQHDEYFKNKICNLLSKITPLTRATMIKSSASARNYYVNTLEKVLAQLNARFDSRYSFSHDLMDYQKILADFNGVLREKNLDLSAFTEEQICNNPSLHLLREMSIFYQQKAGVYGQPAYVSINVPG